MLTPSFHKKARTRPCGVSFPFGVTPRNSQTHLPQVKASPQIYKGTRCLQAGSQHLQQSSNLRISGPQQFLGLESAGNLQTVQDPEMPF